jgi:hypothetical protein
MLEGIRDCPACYGPCLWNEDRCIGCGTSLESPEFVQGGSSWLDGGRTEPLGPAPPTEGARSRASEDIEESRHALP